MQALSRQKIESPPDSRSIEVAVRKWLVVFGTLFNREITPFLIGSWCEVLAPLSPEQIERGCMETARSWTFAHFPTPGAVLSQFSKAEEKGSTLEAENEWRALLAWIDKNFHPDLGVDKSAPHLSATTLHAAKATGGFRYIANCPERELVWCRNHFLAAFKNAHETQKVEHLLTDGEAKRILARLSAPVVLNVKQLPTELEVNRPQREEVRAVLAKVAESRPAYQPPSECLTKRLGSRKKT